jgi:hypothetical protein
MNKLFFPSGKVHPKYAQYIKWSFISNIIVSAEFVLSTHSVLNSVSINTDTIRTVNYIGKDIIGQVGSLLYLSQIGTKPDDNSKKFLLQSNLIQQTSLFIECLTPNFANYFIYISGGANIAANISFLGIGSVTAKCIQTLATDNNTGEVYAKIGAINTISSSIGMALGLCIMSVLPSNEGVFLMIPVLGMLRIYTVGKAIDGIL